MQIRELANFSDTEIVGINLRVQGLQVRSVDKFSSGYCVLLSSGDCLRGRGHDRLENLKLPAKPPGSGYRIRRYGEFGSTIN